MGTGNIGSKSWWDKFFDLRTKVAPSPLLNWERRNFARAMVQSGSEQVYLERIVTALDNGERDLARSLLGYLVTEVWRSLDSKDTMQRFKLMFLKHMYSLLMQCAENPQYTRFVLQILCDKLSALPDKGYVQLSQAYCKYLLDLVPYEVKESKKDKDIVKVVNDLRGVLNDLGTPVFGVDDGRYAYDFYRRADIFLQEHYASPLSALRARSYAGTYSPRVFELSNALLDTLRTDEQILPAIYVHKYWEHIRKHQQVLLADLSLPERRVCERIIELTAAYPGGDQQELGFALTSKDYRTFTLTITNIGGGHIRNVSINSDTFSLNSSPAFSIAPWASEDVRLRLDKERNGVHEVLVTFGGKVLSMIRRRLACKTRTGVREFDSIRVPLVDQRYSLTSRWVVQRNALLVRLQRPLLTQSEGSVRMVCGIPRIGKTTLLKQFRQWIENNGKGLVLDLDMQLLLPRDKDQSLGVIDTRLHSFLRNALKECGESCIDKEKCRFLLDLRDELGDEHSSSSALLSKFIDGLATCAEQTRLVIFIDELSLLALKNFPLLKTFLEYLGPQLKARLNHPNIHVLLCGQEDLPHLSQSLNYPLLSSVDPEPVVVGNLGREQMRTVLEYPFKGPTGERYHPDLWYDDLALDFIEQYTGGHPLLLKLITRAVAELIRVGAMGVPIQETTIYRLLEESIEPTDNHDFGLRADELRYSLTRAGQLILDNMTPYTNRKLDDILNWRTMDGVSELYRLGILRLTNEGEPRMGIGLLENL